jgi:hypothetical protein
VNVPAKLAEPTTALVPDERRRLADLEAKIEHGLRVFVETGQALRAIRDERLYRETHRTFEDYCRERWGFGDRRARYLMVAAEVGTMVPVSNERQARELVPLLDEGYDVIAAWAELKRRHGDKLTAEKIRRAVDALMNREALAQAGQLNFVDEVEARYDPERASELTHQWIGLSVFRESPKTNKLAISFASEEDREEFLGRLRFAMSDERACPHCGGDLKAWIEEKRPAHASEHPQRRRNGANPDLARTKLDPVFHDDQLRLDVEGGGAPSRQLQAARRPAAPFVASPEPVLPHRRAREGRP